MLNKKFLVSELALILVCLLFSGCGYKESVSDDRSKDMAVTITYAAGKDATPVTKELIRKFEEKNPNIKIKLQEMPTSSDDQHNTYVTSLSAGSSDIDVLSMDMVWIPQFAAAGWLTPLDNRFAKDERSKFIDGSIKASEYNGSIWGVPRYADLGMLFYRKDIIPTPPRTWEELIEMSKQNVGKNGTKFGMVFQANQYEGLVCDAVEYIGSNGGKILDGNKVVINSPQTIQGLQYMIDIKNQIAPEGVTSYQEEDSRNIFQQGDAIFMRNWSYAWTLGNASNSKIKDKIGMAPMPKGKDGIIGTSALGGWQLVINKNSKNQEASWKFIQYATSEEGQKIAALDGGILPSRKALYEDKDILAKYPFFKDLLPVIITAVPRPLSPYYPQMSDSMQTNFHKALFGKISAEEAVKNIEKDLNDIIAKK